MMSLFDGFLSMQKVEKTVADIIAPISNIVAELKDHLAAKVKEEEEHLAEMVSRQHLAELASEAQVAAKKHIENFEKLLGIV